MSWFTPFVNSRIEHLFELFLELQLFSPFSDIKSLDKVAAIIGENLSRARMWQQLEGDAFQVAYNCMCRIAHPLPA